MEIGTSFSFDVLIKILGIQFKKIDAVTLNDWEINGAILTKNGGTQYFCAQAISLQCTSEQLATLLKESNKQAAFFVGGVELFAVIVGNMLLWIYHQGNLVCHGKRGKLSILWTSFFVGAILYLFFSGQVNYEYQYLLILNKWTRMALLLFPMIGVITVCTKFQSISAGNMEIFLQQQNYNGKQRRKFIRIILLVLLITAAPVYFFKLNSDLSFHNDEHQMVESAVGFLETGHFLRWNWGVDDLPLLEYKGVWPHVLMLAGVFRYFGVSVVSARALSAIFGIAFLVFFFLILTKIFHNEKYSLVCCLLYLFHPGMIEIYRTVRMYASGEVVTLLFFWSVYKALTTKNHFKTENGFVKWIQKYCDYSWYWCLATLICMFFLYFLVGGVLISCIGLAAFIFYRFFIEKESRDLLAITVLLVVGGSLGIILLCYYTGLFPELINWPIFRSIILHTGLADGNQILYLWNLLDVPFGFIGGAFLVLLGYWVCIQKRKESPAYMFVMLVQLVSLLFFVFFTKRYYQFRYAAFLVQLTIIIEVFGLFQLFFMFRKKGKRVLAVTVTGAVIGSFALHANDLYGAHTEWANFAPAYKQLQQDAQQEELDAIDVYSYHSRYYYLQNVEQAIFHEIMSAKDADYYSLNWQARDEIEDILKDTEKNKESEIVGYIIFEDEKEESASQIFREFLHQGTDRIAGELDSNRVNIYKYRFVNPTNFLIGPEANINWVTDGSQQIQCASTDNSIIIRVENEGLLPDTAFVDVEIVYFTNQGERRTIFAQCITKKASQGNVSYYQVSIPQDFDTIQGASLGKKIYLYGPIGFTQL